MFRHSWYTILGQECFAISVIMILVNSIDTLQYLLQSAYIVSIWFWPCSVERRRNFRSQSTTFHWYPDIYYDALIDGSVVRTFLYSSLDIEFLISQAYGCVRKVLTIVSALNVSSTSPSRKGVNSLRLDMEYYYVRENIRSELRFINL